MADSASWGYALWKILNTMIATNNVCNMFAIQACSYALSCIGKSLAMHLLATTDDIEQ